VLSNIQIPVITRFATYAIMLKSLKDHRNAILSTVTSSDFLVVASKAAKDQRAATIDEGPVQEEIQDAEDALEEGATLCQVSTRCG
jgi:hypothetical protein